MDLLAITLLPVAALVAANQLLPTRLMSWKAIAVVAMVFAGSALILFNGVNQSCKINKSECFGAEATAWVIGAVWLLALVIFLLRTQSGALSKGGHAQ